MRFAYYDHPKRRGLPPIHAIEERGPYVGPAMPICGSEPDPDYVYPVESDYDYRANTTCKRCAAIIAKREGAAS